MESRAAAKKVFRLVLRCHQVLSGSLANSHLPQESRLSANDKSNKEMKPRAVHRPVITTAEKNYGKSRPALQSYRATSHCLKWGPLPPNEVGRIAQHVRK